ncbi:hypothetical protein C8J56DRAFT_1022189 [Mycena floridula]|nr:hypothetical protein C8J56DRAFT_1022189 [Mycena floridula]
MTHVMSADSLLSAFSKLRAQVEQVDWDTADAPRVYGEGRRWAWFVGLAVERFEIWMRSPKFVPPASPTWLFAAHPKYIPPIDVLMIWHAYLLNPSSYAEDAIRLVALNPGYKKLQVRIFVEILQSLSADETFLENISQDQVRMWRRITRTAFNALPPFDSKVNKNKEWPRAQEILITREISCPRCHASNPKEYIHSSGTGYLQKSFIMICQVCQRHFNKEVLGIHKFIRDLISTKPYIAGTLHFIDDPYSTERAEKTKKKALILTLNSSMEGTQAGLDPSTRRKSVLNGPIAEKICNAYSDDKNFSIDLVGATLRQGAFIQKMDSMAWIAPAFLAQDSSQALNQAIARYHAFLDLLSTSPKSFFVPTLDIDLVWHTHQLMLTKYVEDCIEFVGRFVDQAESSDETAHSTDKVEESKLEESFDRTCRAWQKRFNVNYTHCGCPLLSPSIRHKLSSFRKGPVRSVGLDAAHDPFATHPSDHNAVFDPLSSNRQGIKESKADHDPAFLPVISMDHHLSTCIPSSGLLSIDSGPCQSGDSTEEEEEDIEYSINRSDNHASVAWGKFVDGLGATLFNAANCGGAGFCGGGNGGGCGGGGGGGGCGGGGGGGGCGGGGGGGGGCGGGGGGGCGGG